LSRTESDHQLVFSYGSNMDLADVARWANDHGYSAPMVHKSAVGILPDHEFRWNYYSRSRGGGAANLGMSRGTRVAGLVCWVDRATLQLFDKKEGHPNRYRRSLSQIDLCAGGSVHAWVYRVLPSFEQNEVVWPSRAYLELMIVAAQTAGLPDWHINALLNLADDLKHVPGSPKIGALEP